MCSCMNCQGAPLDETLIAALHSAVVRSLVGMDSVMPAKIGVPIERLESVNMEAARVRCRDKKKFTFSQASHKHLNGRRLRGDMAVMPKERIVNNKR